MAHSTNWLVDPLRLTRDFFQVARSYDCPPTLKLEDILGSTVIC